MKVKELIEELQKMPAEKPVFVVDELAEVLMEIVTITNSEEDATVIVKAE